MTHWIRIQNTLKAKAALTLLTPAQRACYEQVVALMKIEPRMNLVGHPGVGKTFLAWVLAREVVLQRRLYIRTPDDAPAVGHPQVKTRW